VLRAGVMGRSRGVGALETGVSGVQKGRRGIEPAPCRLRGDIWYIGTLVNWLPNRMNRRFVVAEGTW
jgi:hypothetical protein